MLNKAEQEQVERVREEIREETRQLYWWSRQHPQPTEKVNLEELTVRFANKILSIDGLLIKHPDQSKPSCPYEIREINTRKHWYFQAQEDMADFVRVIKEAHSD